MRQSNWSVEAKNVKSQCSWFLCFVCVSLGVDIFVWATTKWSVQLNSWKLKRPLCWTLKLSIFQGTHEAVEYLLIQQEHAVRVLSRFRSSNWWDWRKDKQVEWVCTVVMMCSCTVWLLPECKEYSKLSRIDLYPTFGFVGGTQSSVNEFPHMSAIGISEIGDILWQCGGSLISNEYVLTAAHCALNKVESMIVRVGDKNLQKTDDGATPQEFKVKRILIHPQYKKGLKYHDIALLQLSKKATWVEQFLLLLGLP